MNLSQLYYFKKLAELQHYTKAAKELYITQPSLSDSMASLEKELGVTLFQKEGRNIRLTKYGREFYGHVTAALRELEHGIAMVKRHSGQIGGTVDIGCIPTLLGDYLSEAINNYSTFHNPMTKFSVYQGVTLDIIPGVKSGKYDLGFCSKVENEPDLAFVPITTQEMIAIVNREHPLARQSGVCLEELKHYPLITYRLDIPIGQVVQGLLKPKGIEASYLYDSELTVCGLVSRKPIVGVVARTPYQKQFDNLAALQLLDVARDARLVYMVYSKKNFITSAVEAFADYMVANEMELSTKNDAHGRGDID